MSIGDILDTKIKSFYDKNPLARFDDIPDSLFLEVMQDYADQETQPLRESHDRLVDALTAWVDCNGVDGCYDLYMEIEEALQQAKELKG